MDSGFGLRWLPDCVIASCPDDAAGYLVLGTHPDRPELGPAVCAVTTDGLSALGSVSTGLAHHAGPCHVGASGQAVLIEPGVADSVPRSGG